MLAAVRKRINVAYQKTSTGEMKERPTLYFPVAYSFLVFSRAKAWHYSMEDQRRQRASAKGRGNHGNDDNFNDETRRISRFLWQERSFLRKRRKKQLTNNTEECNSEGRKKRRKRAMKYQGEVKEQGRRKKMLGRKN